MRLHSENDKVRTWELDNGDWLEQHAVMVGTTITVGISSPSEVYDKAKEMLGMLVLSRVKQVSDEEPIGEIEYGVWETNTYVPEEGEESTEPFEMMQLYAEVGAWPRIEES